MKGMKKSLFLLLALLVSGCAPQVASNFQSSSLEQAPSVKVEVALAPTMPNLKTFTVIPISEIDKSAQATGITAQHLTFQARNYMEQLGYRFVSNRNDADLAVFIDGSGQYSEVYVPPSQYTVPIYKPGSTSTYQSSSSGNFSYGGGTSGWGNYSGTTTGTLTTPGYYTSQTYTRPGYTKGYHYPTVIILVYETKTQIPQVTASAVGTSQNPDLRVSAQNLMYSVFGQMPLANQRQDFFKSGQTGIFFVPWTSDGNNYFPILIDITKDSSASKAGLQKGDFIVSIDGQSTQNKTQYELFQLVAGEAGQKRTLVIARGKETRTITLTMASRN